MNIRERHLVFGVYFNNFETKIQFLNDMCFQSVIELIIY